MDRFPFVTLLLAVIAAVVIIGAISLGVMTFWDWVFPDSSRLAALGYFGTYLGGILAIGLAIDLRRKP